MKVGFFMQNIKKGGLDTFVLELLRNWPGNDKLVLFCNGSHPGLKDLSQSLPLSIIVKSYKFLISQDIDRRFNYLYVFMKFLVRASFWLVGFYYQVYVIKKLLKDEELDKLLVINGGYPGGDACLAAIVAWHSLHPDGKAWHNLHNMVVPTSFSILRRIKDN